MCQQPVACTRHEGNYSQGSWEHQPHGGHWSGEEEIRFLIVLEHLEGSATILRHEGFI